MLLDVWSLADANNETRLEHFVMKWSAKTHHVSNPPEAIISDMESNLRGLIYQHDCIGLRLIGLLMHSRGEKKKRKKN